MIAPREIIPQPVGPLTAQLASTARFAVSTRVGRPASGTVMHTTQGVVVKEDPMQARRRGGGTPANQKPRWC